MENLGTSLWITLIGMGLVFIAIILLWGLMAFLVKITEDKPEKESQPIQNAAGINTSMLKAKAAAAAVSAALAVNAATPHQGEIQSPSSQVTAWQSANRANSK
jgi:Na+-transporting methylmalonyl-CoA/oxaloacetate decarboxylase gamma subunit